MTRKINHLFATKKPRAKFWVPFLPTLDCSSNLNNAIKPELFNPYFLFSKSSFRLVVKFTTLRCWVTGAVYSRSFNAPSWTMFVYIINTMVYHYSIQVDHIIKALVPHSFGTDFINWIECMFAPSRLSKQIRCFEFTVSQFHQYDRIILDIFTLFNWIQCIDTIKCEVPWTFSPSSLSKQICSVLNSLSLGFTIWSYNIGHLHHVFNLPLTQIVTMSCSNTYIWFHCSCVVLSYAIL